MTLNELEERLNVLSDAIDDIRSSITSLKINEQLHVKSNTKINAGVATKISYDSNGLVVRGEDLQSSDIPALTINKIIGLKAILDEKVSMVDVERLIRSSSSVDKRSTAVNSGTKINYDENGYIVSSSDLTVDDIPTLPIDKIDGLKDRLELLVGQGIKEVVVDDGYNVKGATYPKITYDHKGRVTGGTGLSLDDIPGELISRVNEIEEKISSLAPLSSLNAVVSSNDKKVDSNVNITPGTFTKVRVDSKGLVTLGEKLTVNDLPTLSIKHIEGLRELLLQKANHDDFINLHDTVSSLLSSMSKVGEVTGMKNSLMTKADDSEVKEIKTRVNRIENMLNTIVSKIPSELIMAQLNQMVNQINDMNGRVSMLENKMTTGTILGYHE